MALLVSKQEAQARRGRVQSALFFIPGTGRPMPPSTSDAAKYLWAFAIAKEKAPDLSVGALKKSER